MKTALDAEYPVDFALLLDFSDFDRFDRKKWVFGQNNFDLFSLFVCAYVLCRQAEEHIPCVAYTYIQNICLFFRSQKTLI